MAAPASDRTDSGTEANRDDKLTRDVVLATALELIDRDGIEALSMRRLAHGARP